MLRPRIIPCLLIDNGGLVKTKHFKEPKYIGDPINTVKIFNEKNADELMILDISATKKSLSPNFELIEKLAVECRMPLCYGGGVTSSKEAIRLVDLGVEKVAFSSAAIHRPSIISETALEVGSQSVVVVLDIIKKISIMKKSSYKLCSHNAKKIHDIDPLIFFKRCQDEGAGEIVINMVNKDGSMEGYDLDFVSKIKSISKVPITFLGGAGSLSDIKKLVNCFGIVGAAAGSLFVFKGKYRAVLINYPNFEEKLGACSTAI